MFCLNIRLVFLLCSCVTIYGKKLFFCENKILLIIVVVFTLICSKALKQPEANPDAKRLYDDLLSNYNRLIRPVVNNTETLTVWLGLKLSQLIEVNLKNQVMTTNLWVPQVSKLIMINGLTERLQRLLIYRNGSTINWNGIQKSMVV